MNEKTAPKSIFKSKTAFAGALATLAGSIGTFAPDFAPWVAQSASGLLMASGLVHISLRFATEGRVVLFADP